MEGVFFFLLFLLSIYIFAAFSGPLALTNFYSFLFYSRTWIHLIGYLLFCSPSPSCRVQSPRDEGFSFVSNDTTITINLSMLQGENTRQALHLSSRFYKRAIGQKCFMFFLVYVYSSPVIQVDPTTYIFGLCSTIERRFKALLSTSTTQLNLASD